MLSHWRVPVFSACVQEEPFAGIMPLHCSNQSGVYKWLEKMVTHHAGNADAPAPAASYGGGPTGGGDSVAAVLPCIVCILALRVQCVCGLA
jgi:hypothetical protein